MMYDPGKMLFTAIVSVMLFLFFRGLDRYTSKKRNLSERGAKHAYFWVTFFCIWQAGSAALIYQSYAEFGTQMLIASLWILLYVKQMLIHRVGYGA